ncbi:MAG TPA: hypothetical protein VFI17_07905 [Solirubrobacterales bacterium]|nr:hypothetical protein [Solirubrobacterales bacterium]
MHRDLKIRGYVVGQFPNLPLWVAVGALVVSWVASAGSTLDDVVRSVFFVALGVWAYLEASEGVNGFRRAVGVVFLALVVVGVARAIG